MALFEKETVSALCVNLGHGSDQKVDGGEVTRASQVHGNNSSNPTKLGFLRCWR